MKKRLFTFLFLLLSICLLLSCSPSEALPSMKLNIKNLHAKADQSYITNLAVTTWKDDLQQRGVNFDPTNDEGKDLTISVELGSGTSSSGRTQNVTLAIEDPQGHLSSVKAFYETSALTTTGVMMYEAVKKLDNNMAARLNGSNPESTNVAPEKKTSDLYQKK